MSHSFPHPPSSVLSVEQWERLESWAWPKGQRDILARGSFGQSVLHLSSLVEAFYDIFEVALRVGCPINAKDHLGATPLFYALKGDNEKALMTLVEKGADLSVEDNEGETLLHVALGHALWEVSEYLIEQEAPLNQMNPKGETPLHVALKNEAEVSAGLIEKMVEHGLDLTLRDQTGRTCLEIVEHWNWTRSHPEDYREVYTLLQVLTEQQQLQQTLEARQESSKGARL